MWHIVWHFFTPLLSVLMGKSTTEGSAQPRCQSGWAGAAASPTAVGQELAAGGRSKTMEELHRSHHWYSGCSAAQRHGRVAVTWLLKTTGLTYLLKIHYEMQQCLQTQSHRPLRAWEQAFRLEHGFCALPEAPTGARPEPRLRGCQDRELRLPVSTQQ